MTLRIEAGFDIAIVGAMDITFTESLGGGAVTASLTSGTRCHTDISAVVAGYTSLAAALKTVMEAASANGLTYTITWSTTLQQYTISVGSGTFSILFSGNNGTRMRHALGLSQTSYSTAASHTSDMTPYYAITCAQEGPSGDSDIYEGGEVAAEQENDAGAHDGVAWTAVADYRDYTIELESKSRVFIYEADDGTTASDVPWTFEHMFKHCRNQQPFLLRNSLTSRNSVHYFRAAGAAFSEQNRVRRAEDYDEQWDIHHFTRHKGFI